MSAPGRQRLLRVSSLLVLLLAVAPNVLFVGHWPVIGDSRIDTREEAAEHAAHCHGGEQGCSQSEVFSQALPAATNAFLIVVIGGMVLLIEAKSRLQHDEPDRRLRKPPQLIPASAS